MRQEDSGEDRITGRIGDQFGSGISRGTDRTIACTLGLGVQQRETAKFGSASDHRASTVALKAQRERESPPLPSSERVLGTIELSWDHGTLND